MGSLSPVITHADLGVGKGSYSVTSCLTSPTSMTRMRAATLNPAPAPPTTLYIPAWLNFSPSLLPLIFFLQQSLVLVQKPALLYTLPLSPVVVQAHTTSLRIAYLHPELSRLA